MIINSLLDTDLYKFTMQQAVFCEFPNVDVEYQFKCRNKDVVFSDAMFVQINANIKHLCSLRFTEDELNYLSGLRFMKPHYIEYLRLFQLQERHIKTQIIDGKLDITIKGNWLNTILFEVPVLAIVNECYFADKGNPLGMKNLLEKIGKVRLMDKGFKFSDFGARRRNSFDWQDRVIVYLAQQLKDNFLGTSNVYFSKKYNLTPIGTMAHEWLQAGQALTRIIDSQKFMLQKWADVYRGDLGIALSDVVGVDAFIRDFDSYFCKLFDGCRHDSGDPIEWAYKILNMYESYNIDTKTKRLVFSDSLDVDKAYSIYQELKDKAKISFGIGTNLTNDIGITPLNIVLKMTECNGQPVAKISDSSGKGMCKDQNYVDYVKSVFKIK